MNGSSGYQQYKPIYSPISEPDVPIDVLNTQQFANGLYASPLNIDYLVQVEMDRVKENYLYKENEYVEQMLAENPITIERRTNQEQQPSSEDEVDVVSVISSAEKRRNKFLQEQRAEACRRSRYNNKIKKAKSKYRYQFMSQKLVQSTEIFQSIRDLIARAEDDLLNRGINRATIQNLRDTYCMDQATNNVLQLGPLVQLDL